MKTGKKILLGAGIVLGVILLAAAGLIGWLTVREFNPAAVEDVEVNRIVPSKGVLSPGDSLTILSLNTGYAGLGADSDFFMDGGKEVVPTRDQVQTNLMGLTGQLIEHRADVYFLQEVDTNSSRSSSVDQSGIYWYNLRLSDETVPYSSSHALNYSCDFVPFPFPPIGKVHSGLQTLSRFSVSNAQRIALPCPFSWPVSAANLKRCLLVSRVPLGAGKELVLVNLHLEAYDDGEGKAAQTKMLMDFLTSEYEKGNYVIAGGDFNQTFPGGLDAFPIQDPELWTPGVLENEMLPEGWQFACDLSVPSCRLLNHPYDPDPDGNQFYVIDGFILSPNVALDSVETIDCQFAFTDHNPVFLQATLVS